MLMLVIASIIGILTIAVDDMLLLLWLLLIPLLLDTIRH